MEKHKELFKEIKPSLGWNGEKISEAHRMAYREKLKELLGYGTFSFCDPDFNIIKEELLNGRRHIHFAVQTEKGYYASCHLLLPENMPDGKLPLCVGLQGHVSGAHLSIGVEKFPYDEVYLASENVDFCVQAVNNGFAGLAIEQRGFGENGGDNENGWTQCQQPAMTALLMGRTLIGERVWDVQRVIDCVQEKFSDIITMNHSVLLGMSGGGTATYYTACLDDRFEVYVPGVALCTFYNSIVEISHCVCNYIPNIARYFDMGDMAVMIAPKKLIVASGENDQWFPLDGARRTYSKIKDIYRSVGAEENCYQTIGDRGHTFYPETAWPAIKEMLQKHV
ncbi:MAG: hypothetical protein IJZ93_07125 [Clostridia bacterium]|nr:hypothetical protein [Clostridia bacterium]